MLKIQRTTNGDVMFAVSGRLDSESVGELSGLLAREASGRTVTLELHDLVLADRAAVSFLRTCQTKGIVLRNCPPYIQLWIASDGDQV